MEFSRRLIGLAVISLSLAACGDGSSDLFPEEDGSGSGAAINADGSSASTKTTIETSEGGTITQETGANLAVELPAGLTLFPGAKVVANTRTSSDQGNQTTIMFESKAAPVDVIAHYKKQAEEADLELPIALTFEDSSTIAGDRASDGLKLTVSATRPKDADATTVMLNVSRAKAD